jgi:hypothetical protein
MSFSFDNLAGLTPIGQSKPFPLLYGIKWRADGILKKRTPAEIGRAATQIQEAITSFKEESVAEETERYIKRLCEEGGWELHYLADDRSGDNYMPTEDEIRDLINNWPSWAADRPRIPAAEDIPDFDALQEVLCNGYPFDHIEDFSSAWEAEMYAVLALMKLEEAAAALYLPPEEKTDNGTLIYRSRHPWKTSAIVDAANLMIEATEIICWAERELSDVQLRKLRDEERDRLTEKIKVETLKENGRLGGNSRLPDNRKARKFVVCEWIKHRDAYDGNKSSFARVYVKRVFNEFEVIITEKQMREVWLKDDPLSTSKRAGLLEGG